MRIVTLTTAALALTAGLASATTFGIADRNDDGAISKGEFAQVFGPELDAFTFSVVDHDNDGMISSGEFTAAQNSASGPLVSAN